MRTQYISRVELEHLLAALMPENRLAMELSLATGLRIGDVLSITSAQLEKAKDTRRMTVRESKTGKNRRIYIPVELYEKMTKIAGKKYVFQHRLNANKTRTRQAVFKDIKRVAKAFRLKQNIAPHTARKVYAVEFYHKTGDLYRVQSLLNHSSEAVTMLYALADELTERTLKLGTKKSGRM